MLCTIMMCNQNHFIMKVNFFFFFFAYAVTKLHVIASTKFIHMITCFPIMLILFLFTNLIASPFYQKRLKQKFHKPTKSKNNHLKVKIVKTIVLMYCVCPKQREVAEGDCQFSFEYCWLHLILIRCSLYGMLSS